MAEKRFTYIKNALITQYQSIPIQEIGKGKAFHCQGVVDELNKLWNENEQLKKELKRCKDWINSDKNDYELTLSFIKNKGYSLKDVLEYEKELKSE